MKKMTKQKKRQLRRGIVLVIAGGVIAAAVLGLVCTVAGFVYHRYFSDDISINYDKITMEKPEITEAFLTPNINSRPQLPLETVKGIVIHYTANPGSTAIANRNYFESRKDEEDASANKVSSHFIVGLKGEIVQCIPLDEIAYASNERNQDTISIECCHPDKSGKFNDKTYDALIRLCAWLCDTYEIESKEDIIRHYDVTSKLCPRYYVKHEKAWESLKTSVWTSLQDAQYNYSSPK
jgi:N-acetylmuramoyl-L-alanine amidase CwlA